MKLSPRENSSDLDRARELARRLRDGGPIAASMPPPAPFVRFGFAPGPGRVPPPMREVGRAFVAPEPGHSPLSELEPPPSVSPEIETVPEAITFSTPPRSWPEVLDRCLVHADAAAAMVVDSTGLMVASAGDWEDRSADQIEALGARLQASVEQSRSIDEPCHVVAMALSHGWLSGVRVDTGAGAMALGLLGSDPTGSGAGARAAEEIAAFLAAAIEP